MGPIQPNPVKTHLRVPGAVPRHPPQQCHVPHIGDIPGPGPPYPGPLWPGDPVTGCAARPVSAFWCSPTGCHACSTDDNDNSDRDMARERPGKGTEPRDRERSRAMPPGGGQPMPSPCSTPVPPAPRRCHQLAHGGGGGGRGSFRPGPPTPVPGERWLLPPTPPRVTPAVTLPPPCLAPPLSSELVCGTLGAAQSCQLEAENLG